MQFRSLAFISAVACATNPNVTAPGPAATKSDTNTSDSNLPSLSPSAKKATKLTTVELSLPWDNPCSAKETPSCKISIDADAIKAGAYISANIIYGIKAKGFKGNKKTKIFGRNRKGARKNKLSSLVLTFKKGVERG
ncbi:hypothetical protein DSO57_1018603 [Entomophthora muscae]|uniref:Uncharacterized protein n=1 Tax=Entomophthora muscae TaxID=34485 RepID=A0ACC2S6D4_9FUNG|nr:hypothetical protein DSO57_1018603 [Entomophthora muscae]